MSLHRRRSFIPHPQKIEPCTYILRRYSLPYSAYVLFCDRTPTYRPAASKVVPTDSGDVSYLTHFML